MSTTKALRSHVERTLRKMDTRSTIQDVLGCRITAKSHRRESLQRSLAKTFESQMQPMYHCPHRAGIYNRLCVHEAFGHPTSTTHHALVAAYVCPRPNFRQSHSLPFLSRLSIYGLLQHSSYCMCSCPIARLECIWYCTVVVYEGWRQTGDR